MNNNPIVSVIVPTYDSGATILACLESVKKQTYSDIEIIVVDNNSKDNTKEIAISFTEKVFNRGPERSAQRNFGVSQSKGEYVFIIDSDMELSEKVVASCVEKAQEDKEIKGIVVPEESFGEGFWAQCKKLERSFYVGVPWMEAARFFEKAVYVEMGGYDEAMVSGEDWDLSQRVEGHYKIGRIKEFIYHNEGHIYLSKLLKKKFYYASKFSNYTGKTDSVNIKNQGNIFKRYGLFFSSPRKLFQNPGLGLGMLFMKTGEFFFGGVAYLAHFKKNSIR